MQILYFPGCTLSTKAKGLDITTREALAALGVHLCELPRWTCCGTVFPLAQDNYIQMVAAARLLATSASLGENRLVTVCSFCYHVLKRVNHAIKNNREAKEKINNYLEENYSGEVQPVHPLEIIRNDYGFNRLREKLGDSLKGLRVACYYGCMLVRPPGEMNFGNPDNPTIMEEFIAALGGVPVDFASKTKCCGSYQILNTPDLVANRTKEILASAAASGAQAIITSCPLCQFNLDRQQEKVADKKNFRQIPVLYFTQLLAAVFKVPLDKMGIEEHYVDPRAVLKEI